MVLGCDLDLACECVSYRLVYSSVSEFEFVGFCTCCECEELMSQADAEDWEFGGLSGVEDSAEGLDGVFYGFGVSGAIGDQEALSIARACLFEDVVCGGCVWDNFD